MLVEHERKPIRARGSISVGIKDSFFDLLFTEGGLKNRVVSCSDFLSFREEILSKGETLSVLEAEKILIKG